jgi:hypothetical protein
MKLTNYLDLQTDLVKKRTFLDLAPDEVGLPHEAGPYPTTVLGTVTVRHPQPGYDKGIAPQLLLV